MKKITDTPIFFERNKVFRVYKGGKLFHSFFGDPAVDSNYPEEWIASGVRALNRDSHDPKEGISKIRGTDIYLDDLFKSDKQDMLGGRNDMGILVKVLDSAVRLPVQVHPDRQFSVKNFNSTYGKAESWIVLDTRPGAKLYFGFKEGTTKEDLQKASKNSATDKTAMEDQIIGYSVKKGDVFFIPAKAVHAIGYGCLILEIQEPTDFTIQPEAWCGDYRLNDYEMYMGLDKDTAMSCFDMGIAGKNAIKLAIVDPVVSKTGSVKTETLIDERYTDCFRVNRYTLKADAMTLHNTPAIYVVTDGNGQIECKGFAQSLNKGDYFLLPYSLDGKSTISSEDVIEFVECFKGTGK
ncbi:MAG: class I mannose-6-phosphate isomerase [Clostridia bacterium]